jgi:hypothetical protein
MAFADPQSITVGGTTSSLPRTGSGDNHAVYSKDDRTIVFKVTHQPGKVRTRRSARWDGSKIAADPLLAGVNREASMSFFFNVDVPNIGYSITEQKDFVKGALAQLAASSDALLIKYLGGES